MTILQVKEIADYINNYINGKELNNYKIFPYFSYNNFYKILSNLLNATYHSKSNLIILNNYIINVIDNNDNYEIYITDKYLIEPKGPI